jgi:hypothetical protein
MGSKRTSDGFQEVFQESSRFRPKGQRGATDGNRRGDIYDPRLREDFRAIFVRSDPCRSDMEFDN